MNKWVCFVYREKQKSKQNKFVPLFFGRICGAPICFWSISDLYSVQLARIDYETVSPAGDLNQNTKFRYWFFVVVAIILWPGCIFFFRVVTRKKIKKFSICFFRHQLMWWKKQIFMFRFWWLRKPIFDENSFTTQLSRRWLLYHILNVLSHTLLI